MRFLSIPEIYGAPEDWKVLALDVGEAVSGALTVPNRPYEIIVRNINEGVML